ncbi:hypothetical protein HWV62_3192 [Athelia sp. TMB]|nr:hypothetical protein HWV62_3192 [Athelia sp. TMB]
MTDHAPTYPPRPTIINEVYHDEESYELSESGELFSSQKLGQSDAQPTYQDGNSIDWLREEGAERERVRLLHSHRGLRALFIPFMDASSMWLVIVLTGIGIGLTAGEICTDWKTWGEFLSIRFILGQSLLHSFVYVTLAVVFAGSSAVLVSVYAPYAFHTGIPEIKAILSGYVLDRFLSPWTLLIKSLGLALAVASGLSLGKEVPWVLLAIMGGVLGSLLIKLNVMVAVYRRNSPLNDWPIIEVVFGSAVTAAISYLIVFSRFFVYFAYNRYLDVDELPGCKRQSLWPTCFKSAMSIKQTIMASASIFLPTIAIGASLGRAVGLLTQGLHRAYPTAWVFAACPPDPTVRCVSPGFYAVIGASAMLAGVTRMTRALSHVLPIMISVVISKMVADAFGKDGIYGVWIAMRKYPWLPPVDYRDRGETAAQIMTPVERLVVLEDGCTLRDIGHLQLMLGHACQDNLVKKFDYHGFPVVRGAELVGYVTRDKLMMTIEGLFSREPTLSPERRCSFSERRPDQNVDDLEILCSLLEEATLQLRKELPQELVNLRYILFTHEGNLTGGSTPPRDDISLPTLSIPKEHDYAPPFEHIHTETSRLEHSGEHSQEDVAGSEGDSDTDTDATNSSDEFNWDEEEEEAKETTRLAGTKAKRGRALYLAFMKLARPVRVVLLGILGASILITPLIVVELRFKSSPVRSQVHMWSLWLSIIWASSCVTYIVVDSLPRLSVALIVLFGGQVERLKTEVELILAVSAWLKLFIDVSCAWIALGVLVQFYKPQGSYWYIINRVMQALFTASILFLVEKLFLRFVAINFHRKALSERLAENRLGLKALDRLSNAQPVAKKSPYGKRGHKSPNTASIDFSAFYGRKPSSKEQGAGETSGTASPVTKPTHRKTRSGHEERRRKRRKAMASIIVDQVGSAIGQVTLKNSKFNRQGELGGLSSARKLARKLFTTLNDVYPPRSHLVVDDFIPYFRSTSEAQEAFALFDKDGNGDISKREMRDAVQRIYRERKSLVASLKDVSSAVSKLDYVLIAITLILVGFICLLIFNRSDTITSLVPLATICLGFSFIFGHTCQLLFESLIFIFSTHVFDVGDLVMIDDQPLLVREFGLFATTFRRVDGQEIIAPNSLLNSTKLVHNLRRSGSMWETTNLTISYSTPLEIVDQLKTKLRQYINDNSRDWAGFDMNIDRMEYQNAIWLIVAVQHRPNWQDWGGRWGRRTAFMRHLKTVLEELDVSFVSLLREISRIRPRSLRDFSADNNGPREVFRKWVENLRRRFSPLPDGTTAAVFLILFPEEDSRRKYGMQEARLAQELANCLGVSMKGRGEALRQWNGETATGCLGAEIGKVVDSASSLDNSHISPLSLADVERLLNELASTSAFSDRTFRQSLPSVPRSRNTILRDLYRSIPSLDAAFLTQIILKDIRPLLYPLSETHYTVALTKYNTKAVATLTKEAAMMIWDPSGRMLRTYKVRANLYDAARTWELEPENAYTPDPQLGSPIEIPKSVKGRGCLDALKHFPHSERVWAETKYDGERAQIHVDVREDGSSHITIFSKSKRDSTLDRWGVHEIVRNALGLGVNPSGGPASHKITNIILDAEMVAFSDRRNKVDGKEAVTITTSKFQPFRHRILEDPQPDHSHCSRGQKQNVCTGPPRRSERCRRASLASDASDNGTRHLALVFFDVLVLDSKSLLHTPYSSRRALLESVIQITPGHAMLAERFQISLNGPRGIQGAAEQLRDFWATNIAECEEGLVLKGDEGFYNHYRSPWVKLKRDYIPGYGDTVDLVVLGASWEKDRGRELRVAPTAYTTFYVGGLANACALRKDLEEANFLIKSSDPIRYNPERRIPKGLPYTYNLYSGLPAPAVIFQEPLLAELFGAGFTKSPKSMHYELRFPRLVKLYRPSERSWSDGVTLEDLHKIAREAVGRDRSSKGIEDWTKEMWGQQGSPGIACEQKRKRRVSDWIERLETLDCVKAKRPRRSEPGPKAPSPLKDRRVINSGRTALDAKALGPMTNLTFLIPTPPPSNPQAAEPRTPRKRTAPRTPPTSPARRTGFSIGSPLRNLRSTATHNPAHEETSAISRLITPFQSAEEGSPRHPSYNGAADNGHKITASFLAEKFVWLARPCNTPRPKGQASTRELLSGATRLHSLESLLIGCAWARPDGCLPAAARPRPGVIFVDRSTPEGQEWGRHCMDVLEEKRKTAPATRHPLWVFETTALSLDMFRQLDVDPEALALRRFD